ncbi:hypothetical protein DFJ73DRAFT_763199 [Zopfochytrium polystomum]|nr:hypothetical protein DFJ73DRAFT_763199 [Zopfochytrium polystomum]
MAWGRRREPTSNAQAEGIQKPIVGRCGCGLEYTSRGGLVYHLKLNQPGCREDRQGLASASTSRNELQDSVAQHKSLASMSNEERQSLVEKGKMSEAYKGIPPAQLDKEIHKYLHSIQEAKKVLNAMGCATIILAYKHLHSDKPQRAMPFTNGPTAESAFTGMSGGFSFTNEFSAAVVRHTIGQLKSNPQEVTTRADHIDIDHDVQYVSRALEWYLERSSLVENGQGAKKPRTRTAIRQQLHIVAVLEDPVIKFRVRIPNFDYQRSLVEIVAKLTISRSSKCYSLSQPNNWCQSAPLSFCPLSVLVTNAKKIITSMGCLTVGVHLAVKLQQFQE